MTPANPTSSPSKRAWHAIVAIACIVIIIGGLRAIAPLVNALLLAIVLALMISPILDWFIRRRMNRGLAIAATVAIVVIGGVMLIVVMSVSLVQAARELPQYEARVRSLVESAHALLARWNVDASTFLAADLLDPSRLIALGARLLASLGGLAGGAMLQLVLVVFILIEAPGMRQRLRQAASTQSALTAMRLGQVAGDIQRYISITGWLGFMAALPNTLLLLTLGVDAALLWGAMSFLLSFVPYIGLVLSIIPPALWALLQYGWERAATVVFGMIVINLVVDNILRPRWVGRGLSLSPLAVILSLLFWNLVLGPLGAILATPLTIAVKRALLDRFEETRFLATLIEGDGDSPPAARK